MKHSHVYLLMLACCIFLISCAPQIESTENYQDPNSFLIPLLLDKSDLGDNWDIKAISSVQFSGDAHVEYTEIAKRYFVAFTRRKIHGNVLIQFEIHKMPIMPISLADIHQTIPDNYELTEGKTNNKITRYQGCGETTSTNSTNDCLFVLVKNSLVYSLEIVTKSDNPNRMENIMAIANPLVERMENKLMAWDGQ